MFIGHYAVAFASKRAAPSASLGVLFAAATWLDLVWPLFVLAGWEEVRIEAGNTAFSPLAFVSYPYSHSLAATFGWAVLVGGVYWAVARYSAGAVVVGLGIMSHWVLDAVTHRPDLQLYPGGRAHVGLGLWNSIPGTLIVEGVMFASAVWLYLTGTRPRDRIGRWALNSLVAFAILAYAGAAAGPPPPSVRALAAGTLVSWLVPLWAWWADRHRVATAGAR